MEKKTRHYEFEGAVFDIPMFYDERMDRYIEEYQNFNENPAWTADGFPITHSVEDACPWGKWDNPGRCNDCGSCRFYSSIGAHTRIGVCRQEKRMRANKKCSQEEKQN